MGGMTLKKKIIIGICVSLVLLIGFGIYHSKANSGQFTNRVNFDIKLPKSQGIIEVYYNYDTDYYILQYDAAHFKKVLAMDIWWRRDDNMVKQFNDLVTVLNEWAYLHENSAPLLDPEDPRYEYTSPFKDYPIDIDTIDKYHYKKIKNNSRMLLLMDEDKQIVYVVAYLAAF